MADQRDAGKKLRQANLARQAEWEAHRAKLADERGLTLATLCDMVLGEDALDHSDGALIGAVRALLNRTKRQ
jgi:hypothetical protein